MVSETLPKANHLDIKLLVENYILDVQMTLGQLNHLKNTLKEQRIELLSYRYGDNKRVTLPSTRVVAIVNDPTQISKE